MSKVFSDRFMWGGAVTSFQAEGAWDEDGKGLSIVDARPIKEGTSDWKDAIDFYHRYKEDIALYKELGLNSYRFSVSWSRIYPDGEGEVNQAGINFYNRVIDELIRNGIEPIITIYHFDLPLALAKKYNGFASRKVVDLFEKYSRTLFENFGDRVKKWIAFNEINTARMRLVHYGTKKPQGISEDEFSSIVIHNVFMAHIKATKALHEIVEDGQMGGMLTYITIYPDTSNPEDVLASMKVKEKLNDLYFDLFARGEYPSYYLAELRRKNIQVPAIDNDLELIKNNTVDYLAISYYRSETVSATKGGKKNLLGFKNLVENQYLETSEWGWAIDPIGFKIALKEIYSRYNMPIFVVENGIGVREELNENNTIEDDYRIHYLREHIKQMRSASDEGVDIMGYLVWGWIDILSSHGEMSKRYGFIYVNRGEKDLRDLKRYKKKSFKWFNKVIKSNGEDLS